MEALQRRHVVHGRCHAVTDQPAVLAHRTASPGCGELAALSSWWLLAASLAPVCVKCHHAGCVITCRMRAPACAILAAALIASDRLRHSPAALAPMLAQAGYQVASARRRLIPRSRRDHGGSRRRAHLGWLTSRLRAACITALTQDSHRNAVYELGRPPFTMHDVTGAVSSYRDPP